MTQSEKAYCRTLGLIGILSANFIISIGDSACSQILPDKTLGAENSVVQSERNFRGAPAEIIEGGATRGVNLFHSFLEFNVGTGQRVYFTNPTQVENILSRVTGNNPSNILGTLGVLGNANLFLMNPNGIIFGKNSQLDINGSFIASTASYLSFPNGKQFSATNPNAPPLLNINVPIGLQYGTQQPASITNTANLKVGKDLTLSGGSVTSTGKLAAPAGKVTIEGVSGNVKVQNLSAHTATLSAHRNLILNESLLQTKGDLNLLAQDTVRVRDSVANPFIASAGGQLLIQGARNIDIFALNHHNSGLLAFGDTILRSANTVGGDAHYWSGGSFRVEKLNGSLGSLSSPHDPIIRASGDVNFDSYTGASLHIFAGGSVRINQIAIENADTTDRSIQETVFLSDGKTQLSIDGSTQPTLDIRAGIREIGTPRIIGNTDGFKPNPPNINKTATSANITIDSIKIEQPNGLVFLTNQYKPNSALSDGTIEATNIVTSSDTGNGGSVLIDSKNGINVNLIDASGLSNNIGNGGNVTLLAKNNIEVTDIFTYSSINNEGSIGIGGSVLIDSKSEITVNNQIDASGVIEGIGNGGDVTLLSKDNITVTKILSQTCSGSPCSGLGGDINLNTNGTINILNTISNSSGGKSPTGKKGGDIQINAGSLFVRGALLSTATFGDADSGDVIIQARDAVTFLSSSRVRSRTNDGATGNGGQIRISTEVLNVKNARFTSETSGQGNAGGITINAKNTFIFDGGEIESETGTGGNNLEETNGQGGNINITTPELSLTNGAQISASNIAGTGKGGEINLNARSLSLDNEAKIEASTSGRGNAGSIKVENAEQVNLTNNSSISTSVNRGAVGRGGEINLNARSLFLNNAQITASTSGRGNAGSIKVENAERVNLTNDSSISTSVNRGAVGRGGEINLNARSLFLNNAQITASTSGQGNAGSIIVNGNTFEAKNGGQLRTTTTSGSDAGNITLNQRDNITLSGNQTGLFANTELNSSGKGGSIATNSRNMTISNGASVTVSSQGTGEGGNINVQTDSLTLDRGTISATTDSTEGGNIILSIKDLLLLRNGSRITAQAGQTGNGGDLTIDAGIIFAVPQEDNDIIANASEGNGGNINIRTQGLFNLEEREAVPGNRTNDIDASSEFGIDGEVRIDAPNVDPSRRLVRLPNLTITPEVLQGCRAATQQGASRFISTGRGGLPPGIDEISDRTVWEDMRTPTLSAENPSESDSVESSNSPKPTQIIEAQGWLLGSDGKIVLTAKASSVTPTQIGDSSVGCRISQ
jgi:filamentous hemagglutinin family protein